VTIQRMDNVGIVVDDLQATVAFFRELGMELEGEAQVEGPWVDQCVGLDGVRCDIAMMKTPDGHGRLELSKYLAPMPTGDGPRETPHNTLGMHRVMFAVTDLDDTVARLRKHGAEVVGEVATYQDVVRLCYIRGPEGIFIGLAESLT
jgi:catechol 2,3-dioxygenase-like lactoylglutathione lyase family enzyme